MFAPLQGFPPFVEYISMNWKIRHCEGVGYRSHLPGQVVVCSSGLVGGNSGVTNSSPHTPPVCHSDDFRFLFYHTRQREREREREAIWSNTASLITTWTRVPNSARFLSVCRHNTCREHVDTHRFVRTCLTNDCTVYNGCS